MCDAMGGHQMNHGLCNDDGLQIWEVAVINDCPTVPVEEEDLDVVVPWL